MIYSQKDFDVPISWAKNRTVYHGAIGLEIDPYQEWTHMLWVATIVMLFCSCALCFLYVWWTGPILFSGNEDTNMPQVGKSEGRGDGGGDGKRGRGDDDPNRRGIDSATWFRMMNQADRRDPRQQKEDEQRRANTQCIWIGWQKSDPGYRARTGNSKQYRRCRADCAQGFEPWCRSHYMKLHDDPDDNPNRPRGGQARRGPRGLGDGLEDYTSHPATRRAHSTG